MIAGYDNAVFFSVKPATDKPSLTPTKTTMECVDHKVVFKQDAARRGAESRKK